MNLNNRSNESTADTKTAIHSRAMVTHSLDSIYRAITISERKYYTSIPNNRRLSDINHRQVVSINLGVITSW